jgi:hypothetical protein
LLQLHHLDFNCNKNKLFNNSDATINSAAKLEQWADAKVVKNYPALAEPECLWLFTQANHQNLLIKNHAIKTYGEWRYSSTNFDLGTRWR